MRANKSCKCFLGLRYKVAAVIDIFAFKSDIITLEIDGIIILNKREIKFLMVCNSKYTGGGLKIAPYA